MKKSYVMGCRIVRLGSVGLSVILLIRRIQERKALGFERNTSCFLFSVSIQVFHHARQFASGSGVREMVSRQQRLGESGTQSGLLLQLQTVQPS